MAYPSATGRSAVFALTLQVVAGTGAAMASEAHVPAHSEPAAQEVTAAQATASVAAPARRGGAITRPPVPRWTEDFSSFADPANRMGPWAPIKYVPIGRSGAFVSFGGEYRLRYDDVDNPAFGLNPLKQDDFLQQRAMLHADLRVNQNFRVFAQVADTRTWGKDGAVSAVDQTRTDLQQAFVDFRSTGASPVTVRLGRQELNIGSSRIIGVREAPNTRRSFDGARVMFGAAGANVSAFWTRPVAPGPRSFDDEWDKASRFAGVYATRPLPGSAGGESSIDVFYLNFNRDRATYSGVAGAENRNSIGARWFGRQGNYDFNWEFLYQYGGFAGRDIRAYGIATDTGYTFQSPSLKPRIGLRLDVASGDDDPADGEIGTFNPMYPRNSWYTLASLTSWSNVKSVYPMLQLQPSADVRVTTGVDLLWRESGNDAVYLANMVVAPRTIDNDDKRIGTAYMAEVTWRPTPALSLLTQYVYFDAGAAVTQAGGGNTNFFTVYGTYRF